MRRPYEGRESKESFIVYDFLGFWSGVLMFEDVGLVRVMGSLYFYR